MKRTIATQGADLLAAAVVMSCAIGLVGCKSSGNEPTSIILSDSERQAPPTIKIGDAAPPVVISEWLRGEACVIPEAGKVHIIDFWASWCGPCLAIMPRISKMQEKYAAQGLVAVAVTALDDMNSRSDVTESIEGMDVRLRIAIDGGPKNDSTVAAYMRAARLTGIPQTFIVDRSGRLAWIGHPEDAEPVVEAVLAGTWDISAAAARHLADAEERRISQGLLPEWRAAREAKDQQRHLAVLERMAALSPENVTDNPPFISRGMYIALLNEMGFEERARAAFAAAVNEPEYAKQPWALAEFAKAMGTRDAATVEPVARRAEELVTIRAAATPADSWEAFIADAERSWDGQALHVLSEYRFAKGEADEALRLIRRSIEMCESRRTKLLEIRRGLERTYENAVKEQAGG